MTVYCLFYSIFCLVHLISLERDNSHLEKTSHTVVKWAKLHHILRAWKQRRKMQHCSVSLLIIRTVLLDISSTAEIHNHWCSLPSIRMAKQQNVLEVLHAMVQLVIRNTLFWLKPRVSSENKSENTCCTILLLLSSINLAAALVPGHTASAQSKHQLWMRACEQCNVCMSVDDRGVEGGGANATLTDLPLNIWLLPKPNPDGTLSVCRASPHQSQQATPLSPATSYRVHHWADDCTQKKKQRSLTTLIAV